jgi:adenylosuccinate synthase
MSVVAMIGAQWGDEGKGKIADVLSREAAAMARFNGGNNAGHTVVVGDTKTVLRLAPVGILRPDVRCYVGRGCVVNPAYLLEELGRLRELGVKVDNLAVDWHCHLILPYHIELDKAGDEALGSRRIGTTGRGIGPCYADKAGRLGLRLADLFDEKRLAERLGALADRHAPTLKALGVDVDEKEVLAGLQEAAPKLAPYAGDVAVAMRDEIASGAKVLLEGAHGLLLDLDYGTYPFVTSSTVHPGGAAAGLGLPCGSVDRVLGVVKAYQTRVGEGPFPTELDDELGERLRKRGNEYGSTTGRPRRCGWLDLVLLKFAVETTGVDLIALNKLDVLDGVEAVKVCVAYELDGERLERVPAPFDHIDKVTPVYEELPGWPEGASGATSYAALPAAAKAYVDFIEDFAQAEVAFVSTGPGREEGFLRLEIFP